MQTEHFIQPVISLKSIADIYSNHHRWLTGWLTKKMGCKHQAADLTQDTFARILNTRETLYVAEAKALLTTVAKGLMIDHFRRQALETAYLNALAQTPEAHSLSPESMALILEMLHEVDRMLNNLPSKVRRVFLLSQLDGLTYPEIAKQLNISVSSVQKYMARAYAACYHLRYQN